MVGAMHIRGGRQAAKSRLIIHAGDFLPGEAHYDFGILTLKTIQKVDFGETVPLKQIAELIEARKDDFAQFDAAAIADNIYGINGRAVDMALGTGAEKICLFARLQDGRTLLATTRKDIFNRMIIDR